jgi:hypothetical protein
VALEAHIHISPAFLQNKTVVLESRQCQIVLEFFSLSFIPHSFTMKLLAFLVASRLAAGMPHGPDMDMAAPKPATQSAAPAAPKPAVPAVQVVDAKPSSQAVQATPGKTTTPAGCRKLSTDVDWPADAEWKKVLPEIVARSKTLAKGVYRPDYKVQAESIKDVQNAVKFCAQNNLRLTIIDTG